MKGTFLLFSTVLLSLMAFTLAGFAQQGNVTYVTEAGSGTQDGSSWANAEPGPQLRAALRSVSDSGQVWIAEGTYYPDPNARDSSFYINSGTKVYGGFAGTETSPSQRDWTAHPTILSGDIGVPNDTSDNSRHVVYLRNVGDSTIIDGLTITMGNANGDYFDEGFGGGVVNNSRTVQQGTSYLRGYSSPVFRNCTFLKNYAFRSGGAYSDINQGGTCKAHFYNCVFDSNSSGAGGAYGGTYGGGDITPNFDSCRFVNNIIDTSGTLLTSRGGAICMANGALISNGVPVKASLNNCYFENNAARDGGVINSSGEAMDIRNCVFKNNYAKADAVIFAFGSNYTITGCTFDSNQAQFDVIYFVTGQDQKTKNYITNCIFTNNNCFCSVEYNSGIYQSGHYAIDTTIITNCLFVNGGRYQTIRATASPGGNTVTYLNNVTIADDSSHVLQKIQVKNRGMSASSTAPGGVAKMYINNCIFWYPLSIIGEKAINNYTDGSPGTSGGTAITKVSHSLFRSWQGGWPAPAGQDMGGNLLNVYPGFVDSISNFRLNCNSPAVNAGENSLYPQAAPNVDLDGNSRETAAIDMGCYELPANPVVSIQPNATVQGQQLTMNIQASFTINSLHWDLGDGTTGNGTNVTHTYQQEGNYNVCIQVETPCGEKDTCFTVAIEKGEGLSQAQINNSIKIYPNPVSDYFMITVPAGYAPYILQVFGTTGKVIRQTKVNEMKTSINFKRMPDGLYFLKGTNSRGVWVRRILKE